MTPKPLTLSEKSGLQLFSEGEEEACVCEAFAAGGSETKQASYELATRMGLEPTTSGVTGRRSNQLNYRAIGGNNRARTCDITRVRRALYQLSYAPLSLPSQAATFIILKAPRPVKAKIKIRKIFLS